ncbi:hypothetical protein THASP1DRAFT_27175 [Thamnocephalis sphaerospora]|uniref:Conserved oligomeric Golgi complex subunit 1 n=1 Tax=Thamnocephalis sphaerospora TaxID=78915 RepID=A0A4P9XXG7_9FUNG|nr:hypothetical protein THASP1DRAFT_27175 [Thamnocephalis sphaerospora]|eukprot:RKP11075.1 hypothetical protein THASP1DRAFT_27175 [Thamnocephalis sphaerospora]
MASTATSPRQGSVAPLAHSRRASSLSSRDWSATQAREASVEGIFRKYDITRVRMLERRTRTDVLRARDELRNVFRDGYGHFLSAASTLESMNAAASRGCEHAAYLRDACLSDEDTSERSEPEQKHAEDSHFDAQEAVVVAALVLPQVPEQIWAAISERRYLPACALILLADRLYSRLDKDEVTQLHALTNDVACHVPKQVNLLRKVVIARATTLLEDISVNASMASDAICALRGLGVYASWREAIEALLAARQRVLHATLPDKLGNDAALDVPELGDRIVRALTIIRRTWAHLVQLVYAADGAEHCDDVLAESLLERTRIKTLFAMLQDSFNAINWKNTQQRSLAIRLLQNEGDLLARNIAHSATEQPLSAGYLQEQTAAWTEDALAVLNDSLTRALAPVLDARELVRARTVILEWLDAPDVAGQSVTWKQIRGLLREKQVSLWDDVCRKPFKARFEAIAQRLFDDIAAQPDTVITGLLEDSALQQHADLHALWCEPPLLSQASLQTLRDSSLAALGWSPKVYHAVSALYASLATVHRTYQPALRPRAHVSKSVNATGALGWNPRLADWEREDLATFLSDQQEKALEHYAFGLDRLMGRLIATPTASPRLTDMAELAVESTMMEQRFRQQRFVGEIAGTIARHHDVLARAFGLFDAADNGDSPVTSTAVTQICVRLDALYLKAWQPWIDQVAIQLADVVRRHLAEATNASVCAHAGWVTVPSDDTKADDPGWRVPTQVSPQFLASICDHAATLRRAGITGSGPVFVHASNAFTKQILAVFEETSQAPLQDGVAMLWDADTATQMEVDLSFIVLRLLVPPVSTEKEPQHERLLQALKALLVRRAGEHANRDDCSRALLDASVARFVARTRALLYPYVLETPSTVQSAAEEQRLVRAVPTPRAEPCDRFIPLPVADRSCA